VAQMLILLENIRERLTLIALTAEEYHATIKEAAEDTLKTFADRSIHLTN